MPVQSVPITTKLVSSNSVHGDGYNIIWLSATGRWFSLGTPVSSIKVYQKCSYDENNKSCSKRWRWHDPMGWSLDCQRKKRYKGQYTTIPNKQLLNRICFKLYFTWMIVVFFIQEELISVLYFWFILFWEIVHPGGETMVYL
jgi:hypothetical protein